jgi:hypothetical protein
MNIKRLCKNFLPCLLLVCSQSAVAVETIGWEGLVPPMDMPEDTYSQLDEDLQESLYDLFMVRELKADGQSNENIDSIEKNARAALEKAGIDGDQVLLEVDEFNQQIKENETKLVAELDGKMIRMPGYVLPTEFSGSKVIEFMLVPYVGACVHTPPPPANQMVHVKLKEGFESEGLFMPVWVTGQMSNAMTTQALAFDDGTTQVEAGYTISAADVAPYE